MLRDVVWSIFSDSFAGAFFSVFKHYIITTTAIHAYTIEILLVLIPHIILYHNAQYLHPLMPV
jgi:hypothetical protein